MLLVEDHHEVLDVWKALKVKDTRLVHLDAHIDFGFYPVRPLTEIFKSAKDITELKKSVERALLFEKYNKDLESQQNIGNYIYPAMRDGIVESFCWIIPGNRERFEESLKGLKRLLEKIKSKDPKKTAKTIVAEAGIKSLLYNNEFLVTDILSLKSVRTPVLLDIDVDYLLFDSAREISLMKNIGRRKPWIYPAALAGLIKKKFPRILHTTISYSVNGGYTPICYKFFGDEIALRLGRGRIDQYLEAIFTLRNAGIESYFKKDFDTSFKSFKYALEALEKQEGLGKTFKRKFLAHLYLWLFNICWSDNRLEDARPYYRKALLNDPSLRVADNNFGELYLKKKNLRLARKEFEKIVSCDPLDHNAIRGLGDISFRRKNYAKARDEYDKALRIKKDDKRALFGYAKSCLLLNDIKGARPAVARLMKTDPLSGEAWRLQAELSAGEGAFGKALFLYKKAAVLGPDRPDMYKDIFRILKTEKNKELSDFFKERYKALVNT